MIKRTFNIEKNNFLKEHKIGNDYVLPLVCSAAWHISGAQSYCLNYQFLRLENVQVFKGLRLSEKDKWQAHKVYFQELSGFTYKDSQNADDILIVKSLVFSEAESGKRINHYGATIVFSTQVKPLAEQKTIFFDKKIEASKSTGAGNTSSFNNSYDSNFYENGTLFHGKKLRLINKVLVNDDKHFVCQLTPHALSLQDQGQFLEKEIQHFTIDALLQACLVWVKTHKNLASLPLKIKSLKQLSPIDRDDCYISLQVIKQNDHSMVCNIDCHNKEGEVYVEMKAAEVTVSESLSKQFSI